MRTDVPPTQKRPSNPPALPSDPRAWTLELPFTKPMSLNDRMLWPVKAKVTREWRQAAYILAKAQRIPPCQRVRIELFYTPRDGRARDPLNLVQSLKAVEDGIVDAGVIPDDDARHHESVMPVITAPGPLRPSGNRLWARIWAVEA